jgi:hypothetical protein
MDKSLGVIIFAVGFAHFLYTFLRHKKTLFTMVDLLAMLFGAALWQYPEKVNEVAGYLGSMISR